MQKIKVAILGATGAVGQRFVQLLENHPWFEVHELVGSDRSAGKTYGEAARWVLDGAPPASVRSKTVLPLDAVLESPLVFSALPKEPAVEREPALAAAGHVVSTNASAYRMTPDVPLLLPEVNADHVRLIDVQRRLRGYTTGALVANSNCTAMPVVMALAPLRRYGIEKIQVVSMQAASGAGYPGVPSLDLIDNVIPYVPSDEEKLEVETLKMLGGFAGERIDDYAAVVSASCNRVPVLDGHTVVVSVMLSQQPSMDEIIDVWESWRAEDPAVAALPSAPAQPLYYLTEIDRPQPRRDRNAGNGMSTSIGRLRPCPLFGYKFVALSHNTIRGAAGCAILNAELLVSKGYLGEAQTVMAAAR